LQAVRHLFSRRIDQGAGATAKAEDTGRQFFFVTHSLGSYLSLAALDSYLVGPQGPAFSQLKITSEEKNAVDYFSAHTSAAPTGLPPGAKQ